MPRNPGSGRKPKLNAVAVAADIVALNGNLAAVGRKHGVTRQAVQNLVRDTQALQDVVSDAREGMLDNAESSLYRQVLAGEGWAVCFFLKTQGKKRGYVEAATKSDGPDILGELLRDAVRRGIESGTSPQLGPVGSTSGQPGGAGGGGPAADVADPPPPAAHQ